MRFARSLARHGYQFTNTRSLIWQTSGATDRRWIERKFLTSRRLNLIRITKLTMNFRDLCIDPLREQNHCKRIRCLFSGSNAMQIPRRNCTLRS